MDLSNCESKSLSLTLSVVIVLRKRKKRKAICITYFTRCSEKKEHGEDEALGCKKEKPDRCLFGVRLEKNTEPQLQPAPVPAWVDPQQPLAWFIPDIIAVSKWDGVDVPKRDDIRREWLTAWARQFPKNTFLYVSPSQKDGKPFPPFYTDGKKALFFVIPEENE